MTRSLTNEIITKCIESRSKRLDLGECGLTSIPEKVWEMDWLEELILGNNPSEQSNYDLFKTDSDVYQTLFSISPNEQGSIVNSKLTFTTNNNEPNRFDKEGPVIIPRMKNLRYLNLNRCGLRALEISPDLASLDILMIGGNPRLQQVSVKTGLIKIRVLDVFGLTAGRQHWLIEDLPSVFDPQWIEIVDLSFNRMPQKKRERDSLFSYLEKFSKLKALDIADTGLENLELSSNTLLEYLRAEHCSANRLDLGLLPAGLKTLNAGSNIITAVEMAPDKRLEQLKELLLDNNQISDISFLEAMPALEKLSLSKNRIKKLGSVIQLSRLQHFECEENDIIDLDQVLLLPKLTNLFLAGNKIHDLPPGQIQSPLEVLSLSENDLSDSSAVKQLTEIKTLNKLSLWNNPLPDLPREKLGDSRYFNCLELIAHHFKSLETGKVKNNEIKLILVGNSTAGKTTLRKLLQHKQYNASEDSTHGIVMENWILDNEMLQDFSDTKNVKVHIWDFGGQEYYHETHKLFFSDNAVYILVWEDKTNIHKIIPTKVYETVDGKQKMVTKFIEHQPYDYWLKNIRHYAPTCNLLVVQNKIDVYLEPEDQKNGSPAIPALKKIRIKRLNDKLLDEYDVLQSFDLSLKKYAEKETDYTFDYEKFKRQLTKVLATTVQQFLLGKSYDQMKQKLQVLSSSVNFISYDEYKKICEQAGIATDVERASLSKYLTDTSVILYYPDHPQLSQKVFINPVWVSDTIYNVLDNDVLERSGKFDYAHVVKKIGQALANDFIDLMRNFQLIFEVQADDQQEGGFVAPQYLPESSPNRAYDIYKAICGEPKLIMKFPKFLPKTLMNGLLAEFASSSIDRSYFRYGVAFSSRWLSLPKEDNINIIECDFSQAQILLYSKVDNPTNLRKIFEAILSVYTGFGSLSPVKTDTVTSTVTVLGETYRKEIPVHISVDGINFVSWNELYERKNKLKEDIMDLDDTSLVMPVEGMPVAAGLFKAFYLAETELSTLTIDSAAALQPPKLFISYSHKDEAYKDELTEHLSGMRRTGEIKDWDDRAIVAGEKWDDVIKRNIEEADIILFLLSSSFLASDYIHNIEIKNAIERHNKNKVIIIPVPVRPCDVQSLPLKDIQAATKDFQFISTFSSRDEGWTKVIGSVRKAIEKWKQRPAN